MKTGLGEKILITAGLALIGVCGGVLLSKFRWRRELERTVEESVDAWEAEGGTILEPLE